VRSARQRRGHPVTGGAQETLVVEYPCDRFCRIEVELNGEHAQITLQQMRDKAEGMHRRVHDPEVAEVDAPVVEPEATGRAAPTVFLAAPGRGADRPSRR
jgi:hypothetical protein